MRCSPSGNTTGRTPPAGRVRTTPRCRAPLMRSSGWSRPVGMVRPGAARTVSAPTPSPRRHHHHRSRRGPAHHRRQRRGTAPRITGPTSGRIAAGRPTMPRPPRRTRRLVVVRPLPAARPAERQLDVRWARAQLCRIRAGLPGRHGVALAGATENVTPTGRSNAAPDTLRCTAEFLDPEAVDRAAWLHFGRMGRRDRSGRQRPHRLPQPRGCPSPRGHPDTADGYTGGD